MILIPRNGMDSAEADSMAEAEIATTREQPVPPSMILDLPEEILEMVIGYLLRPKDVASLGRTCSRLQNLTDARQFRRMAIDLNADPYIAFSSADAWRPPQRSLRHIRELTFYRADIRSKRRQRHEEVLSKAIFRIQTILGMLPRNSLKRLASPPSLAWDRQLLLYLLNTQQNLEHLEGVWTQANVRHMPNTVMTSLASLQSLSLPERVSSPDHLSWYGALIRDCPRLKTLAIRTKKYHCAECASRNGCVHLDKMPALRDSVEAMGCLFRALFVVPFLDDVGTPLVKLKELCLQQQDLEFAAAGICGLVDFWHLQHLHLYDCENVDVFLWAMSWKFAEALRIDPSGKPALRGFIFDHIEHEHFGALEAFLGSFETLQYLQIRCENSAAPFDFANVTHHRETLADLYIGIGNNRADSPDHWRMPQDLFWQLTADWPKLRQLAVAMPAVPVRWRGETSTAFDYAVRDLASSEFQIVRFLTWPTPHDSDIEADDPSSSFNKEVDKFATTLFKEIKRQCRSGPPALKILIIGDSSYDDAALGPSRIYIDGLHPRMYLFGSQRDCFGHEDTVAIPLRLQDARHLMPHFDAIVPTMHGVHEDYGLGLGDYRLGTHQPRSRSALNGIWH